MALECHYDISLKEIRPIIAAEISIIIPVKDNQSGIDKFLESFFKTHTPADYPCEIILVDNNSSVPVLISGFNTDLELPIDIYLCEKPGPAAARNLGAKNAKGKWLLFMDSDCIPTECMIDGYLRRRKRAVAYQGSVSIVGKDFLSSYYLSQKIHLPPAAFDGSPKYLVTANTLINRTAFEKISGFDERFTLAGGEDIELAIRLSEIGQLAYATDSVIQHNFDDGMAGFVRRFIRYGKGNRIISRLHNENMFPLPSTAKNKKVIVNNFLVILQWACLLWGYLKMSWLLTIKKV